MQGARCSDDVSQIPGFDRLKGPFREGVTIEVKLNGARPILNEQEGAAVADQPTGHREPMICFLELGLVLEFKIALQITGQRCAAEIIGKRGARLTQCSKLCAALCYQAIFVFRLLWIVHVCIPFVLPYRPCLRDA